MKEHNRMTLIINRQPGALEGGPPPVYPMVTPRLPRGPQLTSSVPIFPYGSTLRADGH